MAAAQAVVSSKTEPRCGFGFLQRPIYRLELSRSGMHHILLDERVLLG